MLKCPVVPMAVAVLVALLSANSLAQSTDAGQNSQSLSEKELANQRRSTLALKAFRKKLAAGDVRGARDDLETLSLASPQSMVLSNYPNVFVPLYRAVFDATFETTPERRLALAESLPAKTDASFASVVAESQPEEIPGIVLRNAGRPAAVAAHFLAARLHFSRGNYAGARSWLLPLSQGHMPKGIRQAAKSLITTFPPTDHASAKSDAEKSQPSLDAAEFKLPEHLLWKSVSSMSPRLQKQIDAFLKAAHEVRTAPQTVWRDRIDGGVVYRRSMRGLKAIDVESGETNWEYPIGTDINSLITSDRANSSVFTNLSASTVDLSTFANVEKSPLVSAFCRDSSLARMSADSNNLYLVVENSEAASFRAMFGGVVSSQYLTAKFSPKLIAVEKHTGRRVWTTGKTTLQDALGATSSAGLWFAGPPQTNGRKLFSVFEWDGVMRLGCLNSATGELDWSVGLAFPEQTIDKDRNRRFRAATPRLKEGLLWCTTTTGWLMCVDEMTQSTVFARKLDTQSTVQTRVTFGRGQPVSQTPLFSLADRWSTERLLPAEGRLAVISSSTQDIVVVDEITGQQFARMPISRGEFYIYSDDTRIVVADAKRIRAFRIADAQKLWDVELDAKYGYPTGQAVRQGPHLLVPMSDGSVAQFALQSGQILAASDPVLPGGRWGRLDSTADLNGDVLYLSPDRVSRISTHLPEPTKAGPLEIASGLMAGGNWEKAITAADLVSKTDRDRVEAESIIFSARLQLAATDDAEKHLAELKSTQLTAEQSVQILVFETASAFNRKDITTSAQKIVDLLLLDSLRHTDVPAISTLWGADTKVDSDDRPPLLLAKQSLLTWAAMRFSELAKLSSDSIAVDRLKELSNETILAIHHPLVLPTIHDRLKVADSEELFWQLLQHAVDIRSHQSRLDLSAEVEISLERYSEDSQDLGLPHKSMRLLVGASFQELPKPFQVCVDLLQPGIAEVLSERNAALTGQSFQWNANRYKPVPVRWSQSNAKRSARASVAEPDDLFLGEFNWSFMQNGSRRIVANRLTDVEDKWSVPGNFQGLSKFSMYADMLYRSGTVLLVKTPVGITAVSLLDQRILWTRSPTRKTSMTRSRFRNTNFDQFVAGVHRLPSQLSGSALDILSVGRRWMCVQVGSQIDVMDLYTGRVVWSTKLSRPFNRAVATDDFVIVGTTSNADVVCFDRRTGAHVSVDNAAELSAKIIRNVGPLAVTWQEGGRERPDALEWINVATGESTRSVDLAEMESYHFLDDRTLVGISADQKFMTVDLVNGRSRVYSYRSGDLLQPDNSTAQDEESKPTRPNRGPPGYKPGDHRRVIVTADPLNYYVSNRVPMNAVPFGLASGFSSFSYTGDLRAIDRITGDLRWIIPAKTASVATVDHPELPVLMVWDADSQARGGPGFTKQRVVRAHNKLTGQELFRQHIPSRYGWQYIQLKASRANVVDITVHGTQLRMVGQPLE